VAIDTLALTLDSLCLCSLGIMIITTVTFRDNNSKMGLSTAIKIYQFEYKNEKFWSFFLYSKEVNKGLAGKAFLSSYLT
jgi:hypothetical protein